VLELLDVRPRQKVGARRKDLAQLDVGGAQLNEPFLECLGFCGGFSVAGAVSGGQTGPFEIEKALTLREVPQTVVGKQPERRGEARKMPWPKWLRIASP
jgi:hypothetical protein